MPSASCYFSTKPGPAMRSVHEGIPPVERRSQPRSGIRCEAGSPFAFAYPTVCFTFALFTCAPHPRVRSTECRALWQSGPERRGNSRRSSSLMRRVLWPEACNQAAPCGTPLADLHILTREGADHFLRTLAAAHEHQAIGVVLTGTGSDGTLGLRAIRQKGGLSIVQDPGEAEYDGMPRSAMDNGPVDAVLRLAEIPAAILQYSSVQPRLKVVEEEAALEQTTQQFLQRLCAQVRTRTGRDFSQYKSSTILRRIARRMQFHHIEEPESQDMAKPRIGKKRPKLASTPTWSSPCPWTRSINCY